MTAIVPITYGNGQVEYLQLQAWTDPDRATRIQHPDHAAVLAFVARALVPSIETQIITVEDE